MESQKTLPEALNQVFDDLKLWITNNFASKEDLENKIHGTTED